MIEKAWRLYKPVRFKTENWQKIKDLADELSEERGSNVYLPDAVMESIKFYKENRPKYGGLGRDEK
jgi:hypothetical protein